MAQLLVEIVESATGPVAAAATSSALSACAAGSEVKVPPRVLKVLEPTSA
jgi:hypothetical protein